MNKLFPSFVSLAPLPVSITYIQKSFSWTMNPGGTSSGVLFSARVTGALAISGDSLSKE